MSEETPQVDPTNESFLTDRMKRSKSMTVDGTNTTRDSLKETLDAQERISATRALKKRGHGIVFGKFRMPGSR